jgi:hypothetical protein
MGIARAGAAFLLTVYYFERGQAFMRSHRNLPGRWVALRLGLDASILLFLRCALLSFAPPSFSLAVERSPPALRALCRGL